VDILAERAANLPAVQGGRSDTNVTVIYDPAKPPLMFDGLLDVFSECRDCGEQMKVITPDQTSHPSCRIKMTKLESLLKGWLSCVTHRDLESARLTRREIKDILREPPDLSTAATDYASFGWHVFPLRAGCGVDGCRHCTPKAPCGKRPYIPKSKGGQGFKQAHCDTDRIKKWWNRHPDCNIGLATGHVFDCIDIDPKSGGVQSLLKMLENHEFEHSAKCNERDPQHRRRCKCKPKVPHGIATTASGGMHLYIPATGLGNFAGIRPGIDFRGLGGYVVAPPSTLGKPGLSYSWLVEPSPKLKGAF
jgi:hypothetical protein